LLRLVLDQPPLAVWSPYGLFLPGLLILLGAIFGALRALLSSPLRAALLEKAVPERRAELEDRFDAAPHLASSAGLSRLLFLIAAVIFLIRGSEPLSSAERLPIWAALSLIAGLLLEALPALALRARGIRFLLLFLPLLRTLAIPLRPFTVLLEGALRVLGADPEQPASDPLAVDLIEVAQDHHRERELNPLERRMIAHVIDLPETDAAEVMTPRTDLTSVPVETTVADALRVSHEAGHSRILVHEGDLDHVVGIFFVKDVLPRLVDDASCAEEEVRVHMRKPYFVPETTRVPALLEDLRRRRLHLCVVVDEYGGTAGVVAIEDLLEEIVGEIEDEHDPTDEALHFERLSEDEAMVDGRYSVADLNEVFGADLPEDKDYDTLGGLLFDRFGHVPAVGEEISVDGLRLEVAAADERRIRLVRVRRGPAAASDAA